MPDLIRERLAVLAPESVAVEDESAQHAGHAGARSGGGHYRLVIVAACFAGQPLQARHRMIYDALAPLMQKQIHALAIQAYSPDEI
jgi:BolA family transcriptional regulator, general stress-responsive regulator